jgi:hypothetical protein
MYIVVEFPATSKAEPTVDIICEQWIAGIFVRFPPRGQHNSCIKNKTLAKNIWRKYNFRILKGSISDLEEAKIVRTRYEKFEDTNSELEFLTQQQEDRNHPVHKLKHTFKNYSYTSKLEQLKKKVNNYYSIELIFI